LRDDLAISYLPLNKKHYLLIRFISPNIAQDNL